MNTNLIHVLAKDGKAEVGNIREAFFMNQLRVVNDPITSPVADFLVGEWTFEGEHPIKDDLYILTSSMRHPN